MSDKFRLKSKKQLRSAWLSISFILFILNEVEMTSEKSNEKAKNFRENGNLSFHNGEFHEALVSYNKSLCHATEAEELAEIFADRSKIYLKTQKYEKCLENIKLAVDHGYDINKLSKLQELEEKCKKFMKLHKSDLSIDPWSFFKLSQPANNRIPFIINSLELREDNKFGRYLVTSSDLKTGDVIAIEEPFYKFIDKEFCYNRCTNCLKSNDLSLLPCARCSNSEFLFQLLFICVYFSFYLQRCIVQTNVKRNMKNSSITSSATKSLGRQFLSYARK